MKCVELKVVNRKEALCILECGGVYVEAGGSVIVDAEVAPRILQTYIMFMDKGEVFEREKKLANGHYELVGAKKKEAPKPAPKEPEKVKDVAENRSMEGSSEVKTK